PALKALCEAQTVGVAATAGAGGTDGALAAEIARRAGRQGRIPVTATLTLSRAQPGHRERSFQQAYTWTEKVPYQVTERVKVGSERVLVQAKTCSNKSPVLRPNGRGGYDKYEVTNTWDCSVYQSRDRYEDRVVTRYKDVVRNGTRTVVEETSSLAVAGQVALSFPGSPPRTVPLSFSRTAVDTRYNTPHGSKQIAPQNTVAGLTAAARDELAKALADAAVAAVRDHRTRNWLAEAAAAAQKGDAQTAEDRDVRVAVMRGAVDRASAARFQARYGLSEAQVLAALEGKAPTYAEAAWRATGSDRQMQVGRAADVQDMYGEGLLERGYALGTAGYAISRWSTPDLPIQTPREGYGVTIRMDYPVVAAVFDMREGFVFQDNVLFELALGKRTSDPVAYEGTNEEGFFAANARLGYQAQVGFRGSLFGLLAGARTEGVWFRIGDFQARDSVHSLVGTLEVKVWDRNPMAVQVYGLPFWGDGDVLGGTFDVTLQGNHGLGLRLERWTLEARYAGRTSKDYIDLDKQHVLSADLMYLLRF
ncbi:MAG: hypothetical protein KC613_15165, partial [Myxococcales bacterium]|nr:hypothetical protein [Myxococcales bacterium]